MDFKYILRRNKYVVYLKKADQISTFLALINAPLTMLDFVNARAEKDFINNENRIQICFNANFQKSLLKSSEQIEDINLIKKKYDKDVKMPYLKQLIRKFERKNKDQQKMIDEFLCRESGKLCEAFSTV